jgi:hypothetical protein
MCYKTFGDVMTINRINHGSLAHLGERQLCKLDVVGSSPTGSTKLCQCDASAHTQVALIEQVNEDLELTEGIEYAVVMELVYVSVLEAEF